MTGRLRRLDGPEFMADHDRRIAALERRLRVSQANLPRRVVPGSAPSWAYLTWAEPSFPEATQAGAGEAVPDGSLDPNPWTVQTDDIGGGGLTIDGAEISMPGPGTVVATVASEWNNNATGQRYLGIYAANSDDAVMQEAHTHPSRRMFQNCTLVEKVEAGDNGMVVEVGQFGYLGNIGVTVSLTIAYWAG